MARIGWAVTGAGHLMEETFEVMEELAKEHDISCFLSSAAERVIRIYNLWGRLARICDGGYYRELTLESVEGPSSPLVGRFLRKTYNALIVSPASANTVAKVVSGISDTLVTNAVAQAEKGGVPIVFVPTDQKRGKIETKLPHLIDRALCEKCEGCLVIDLCPEGAIVLSCGLPRINLSKCTGCGICLSKCPLGAVSFGERVAVRTREVDIENVEKLRKNQNFIVLSEPRGILGALRGILGGKSG